MVKQTEQAEINVNSNINYKQMQIAFEKRCAEKAGCEYSYLKERLDEAELLMGMRYIPKSPRHEEWLVWVDSWNVAREMAPNSIDFGLDHKQKVIDAKELLLRCLTSMKLKNGFKANPNWVHVKEFCLLGSTSAYRLCRLLNVDPESNEFVAKQLENNNHE